MSEKITPNINKPNTYTLTQEEIDYLTEYRTRINPLRANNANNPMFIIGNERNNHDGQNAHYIVNIPIAHPMLPILYNAQPQTHTGNNPCNGMIMNGGHHHETRNEHIINQNNRFNYNIKMCIILFCCLISIPILIGTIVIIDIL